MQNIGSFENLALMLNKLSSLVGLCSNVELKFAEPFFIMDMCVANAEFPFPKESQGAGTNGHVRVGIKFDKLQAQPFVDFIDHRSSARITVCENESGWLAETSSYQSAPTWFQDLASYLEMQPRGLVPGQRKVNSINTFVVTALLIMHKNANGERWYPVSEKKGDRNG